MRLAMTILNGRVSPLFDTSKCLDVLEVEGNKVISREMHEIGIEEPLARARWLEEMGIKTLICGAVSRPFFDAVSGCAIQVLPFVAGEATLVVEAFLKGALPNAAMAMPGCGRHRMRCQNGRGQRAGCCRKRGKGK